MYTIPNFTQIEKPQPRKGYNPDLLHPPAIIFEPNEPGITANKVFTQVRDLENKSSDMILPTYLREYILKSKW